MSSMSDFFTRAELRAELLGYGIELGDAQAPSYVFPLDRPRERIPFREAVDLPPILAALESWVNYGIESPILAGHIAALRAAIGY